jgi:hypothetical protein
MNTDFNAMLKQFSEIYAKPCDTAIDWLHQQVSQGRTFAEMWQTCEHATWMLWLAARVGIDHKLLITVVCRVVRETRLYDGRTVWDLLSDDRSRRAVETAEAYVWDEVALEDIELAFAEAAEAADAQAGTSAYAANAAQAASHAVAHAFAHAFAHAAITKTTIPPATVEPFDDAPTAAIASAITYAANITASASRYAAETFASAAADAAHAAAQAPYTVPEADGAARLQSCAIIRETIPFKMIALNMAVFFAQDPGLN